MTSGRHGITYEDVVKAIARLKKKKINITSDNIRYELGTGSKTTVMKHLRSWRLGQPVIEKGERSLQKDMIEILKIMAARLNMELIEGDY